MREVVARPDRPRRCTLPITALRVTPPSRPAIWLALNPSDHSFFKSSTRSSFQAIPSSPALVSGGIHEKRTESGHPGRSWKARSSAGVSRAREPDRPTNNATGNCEGLVLRTLCHAAWRYRYECAVRAHGYSPHRINARYAVGQRAEITTPLMRASSRAGANACQCRSNCDSVTTGRDTTCEFRGWRVACGEYHARALGWPSNA